MLDVSFFKGKRILITGHTGFKGSWMCRLLVNAGAQVTGYALEPQATQELFGLCKLDKDMRSVIGDVRDIKHLKKVFDETSPEIVIHMAAQPLVRDSYSNPVYTYDVNVMGTVNVLECVRTASTVKSFLNVTTDKVYRNKEWEWGYREDEELNGYDPYSNSKSCSELVTSSYKNSYFADGSVAISTARAGNVIGGGDFASDRIIPDCVRAVLEGKNIIVRNPYSIRPYQHVLEPIAAYLMLVQAQYINGDFAGNYNVGPEEKDCITTGELVTLFCNKWNEKTGDNISWKNKCDGGPHEASFLKLDCARIKSKLGWQPRWDIETAIEKIVEWNIFRIDGRDISECIAKQIQDYFEGREISDAERYYK